MNKGGNTKACETVFEVDEHGRLHLKDYEFPKTNSAAYGVNLRPLFSIDALLDAFEVCASLRRSVAALINMGHDLSISAEFEDLQHFILTADDECRDMVKKKAVDWLNEAPDWEQSYLFSVPYDALGAAYEYFKDREQAERQSVGILLAHGDRSGKHRCACLTIDVERANHVARSKKTGI